MRNYFDYRCLLIDVMHAFDLGLDRKLFVEILNVLSGGASTTAESNADKPNPVWLALRNDHKAYLEKNNIVASYDFVNSWQFLKLKAKSMRRFIEQSVQYLLNLKLPLLPAGLDEEEPSRRAQAMEYWTLYMSVSIIFNSYSITMQQVTFLKEVCPAIINYVHISFPSLVTINLHYLHHLWEQIIMFGPPKFWSNYRVRLVTQCYILASLMLDYLHFFVG
jgi:hypothetical protein